MDRTTLAPIAWLTMDAALRDLVMNGHVDFTVMFIKERLIKQIPKSHIDENFEKYLNLLTPHVDAIIIISEAWTLMPYDIDFKYYTLPVDQHPRRVKAVFVTAHSRCGEVLLAKTFKRDAESKLILDREIKEKWTTNAFSFTNGDFSSPFILSEEVYPPQGLSRGRVGPLHH